MHYVASGASGGVRHETAGRGGGEDVARFPSRSPARARLESTGRGDRLSRGEWTVGSVDNSHVNVVQETVTSTYVPLISLIN